LHVIIKLRTTLKEISTAIVFLSSDFLAALTHAITLTANNQKAIAKKLHKTCHMKHILPKSLI